MRAAFFFTWVLLFGLLAWTRCRDAYHCGACVRDDMLRTVPPHEESRLKKIGSALLGATALVVLLLLFAGVLRGMVWGFGEAPALAHIRKPYRS